MDYSTLRNIDEISKGSQALKIPNLNSALKMAEPLRFSGRKALATLSDGTVIQGSKATRQYEKKFSKAQKSLSRKIGSKKGEVRIPVTSGQYSGYIWIVNPVTSGQQFGCIRTVNPASSR